MDYPKELEQLQQTLKNKSLSVLVGAGFSKNVHDKLFLSWWELLDKMVRRMNVKVYPTAFERINGIKATEDDERFKSFVTSQVNQYLEQTDYLQVISDYIRKMGYRETVDVCIEENIPRAIRQNGKLFLRQSDNGTFMDTEISQHDLEVHRKLIKLPWNNIYTTNYDNLLEFCVDTTVITGLEDQVKEYIDEILMLEQNIQNSTMNFDELNGELSRIEEDSTEFSGKGEELLRKKNKLAYQIQYEQSQVEALNRKKWELQDAINDSYNVVRHSSELALKRNRNIIKLHGSLPENDSDPFGFDNEYNKRYIISSEDYEHYPIRHEAFTQLMRISLLQGCFCLIGFSGDDANFMAWISWIRTVIMRERRDDKEDTKIYFIDARATQPADSHKQQFYKNHRIVHIPLGHSSCIDFLEKMSDKPISPGNTRDLLNRLMDYLADISVPDLPQISYEMMAREKYEQYWIKTRITKGSSKEESILKVCETYYKLKELKPYNRIPSFDYLHNHYKCEFILAASDLYPKDGLHEEVEVTLLGTIVLALEDLYLPYSCLITDKKFKQLLDRSKSVSTDLYYSYLKIDAKDAIWKANSKRVKKILRQLAKIKTESYANDVVTLSLMEAAVMFRFNKMSKILNDNFNSSFRNTSLAGYWLFSDRKKGLKQIKEQTYNLAQEYLYAMEIKHMLLAGEQDENLLEKRQRLQQKGLRLLSDNQKYALALFNNEKNRIAPYESDETIGSPFLFENSDKIVSSIQLLGMMLETGLHFSGDRFYLQDKDRVYPVFEQVYQRYPLPVLFFAFQYGDPKYIKRIGQDYAYNTDISVNPKQLFEFLSVAYEESHTPARYNKNILTFLTEFIIIIEPKIWQPFLLKVWMTERENGRLFDEDKRNRLDFIKSGLRYCQDVGVVSEVITDCLQIAVENKMCINSAIDYLFILAKNPFLESLKGVKKQIDSIVIDKMLLILPKIPDYLFILGNIHIFLSKTQVEQIKHALLEMDYTAIRSPNLWSVATYYCKRDTKLQEKVIGELLRSPHLWATGISLTPEGRMSWSSKSSFVKLRELSGSDHKDDLGLVFSNRDVLELYAKMKPKFEEIKAFRSKRAARFNDFFSLLQEMNWFLDMELDRLKLQPDFNRIRSEVIQLCFDGSAERHTLKGLTSDDISSINEAITEITVALFDKSEFDKHKSYIQLVISKVQLKSGPGLILCLEYLVAWCEYLPKKNMYELNSGLLEILNLYKGQYPEQVAIPIVEELLVRLAVVLSNWNLNNEDVVYFLSLIEKSRYNNVRFNLKQKLKNGLNLSL
ncbi:SIR2 family protein [Chitinophaga qingshengii]|uniref:SIR2 family protein n=1 Tax=Chitinophaga qingshengii TaxID=1569794 RepID=A0ABR7TIV1_9BACT|nr:SIR2 family protein [Chitinophaga qingshengii]MBC9930379.1 SIR2 family protein [Chitinophaga qingshengii]